MTGADPSLLLSPVQASPLAVVSDSPAGTFLGLLKSNSFKDKCSSHRQRASPEPERPWMSILTLRLVAQPLSAAPLHAHPAFQLGTPFCRSDAVHWLPCAQVSAGSTDSQTLQSSYQWPTQLCLKIPFFFFKRSVTCFQSLRQVRLFAPPRIAAHQASLSSTISQSLLRPTCIESVKPSNSVRVLNSKRYWKKHNLHDSSCSNFITDLLNLKLSFRKESSLAT